MEIERTNALRIITQRLRMSPVVAILGPRQCGKTTLARQFAQRCAPSRLHTLDLEDPRDAARLDNPMLALEPLTGTVIIDEIQRRPDLFPALRVLVDRQRAVKFLILGSASPDLVAHGAESLAGRISFVHLEGFSLDEVSAEAWKTLWLRGGFPRAFLARSGAASFQWRQDFISMFLERDLPNLGLRIPAPTLRRFWMMLAHNHGQRLNASELGRSLGASDMTVRRYLDILSGTFLIRQLPPWFSNLKKRLVKHPKAYVRDSGLLHALLSLETERDVLGHPKLGASWEGFVIEQVMQQCTLREDEVFFWAAHTGAELDLCFRRRGRWWGIEVKSTEAPTCTKSMRSAQHELSLAHLWVVYPGTKVYPLDPGITAVPITALHTIHA